jgi:SanA protein
MSAIKSRLVCLFSYVWKNTPIRVSLMLFILLLFFLGASIFILSFHVENSMKKYITTPENAPHAHTAIVLGAYVDPDGALSGMLEDRVLTAVELYNAGKVKKLLMTGDHGEVSYDEVNNMRLYAEKKGVPPEDVFMDHAGFKTYESMYRADKVFHVKSALVVTQRFHLSRAVFLARARGIDARGVIADKARYWRVEYNEMREIPARAKDFIQIYVTRPLPTFLGPVISIEGDGRATHDRKAGKR